MCLSLCLSPRVSVCLSVCLPLALSIPLLRIPFQTTNLSTNRTTKKQPIYQSNNPISVFPLKEPTYLPTEQPRSTYQPIEQPYLRIPFQRTNLCTNRTIKKQSINQSNNLTSSFPLKQPTHKPIEQPISYTQPEQ